MQVYWGVRKFVADPDMGDQWLEQTDEWVLLGTHAMSTDDAHALGVEGEWPCKADHAALEGSADGRFAGELIREVVHFGGHDVEGNQPCRELVTREVQL